MRLFILILTSVFVLAGCGDTDEVPIEESENAEIETEEADTETTEVVDEEEDTESEETSNDESSENKEAEDESDKEGSEEEAETEPAEEPAEPVNVMDGTELVTGHWINYSGEDDARGHMTRTEPIEYNAGQDYTVTTASYVSYFYGTEFIKTNNYGHDGPHIIESVAEADRVIVSFSEPEKDTVQLIDEASAEASAGNELNTTPEDLIGRGKPVEEGMTGKIMFGQDFLTEDVFTGERIDDKGNFIEDENYYVTGALAYNPSKDYVITSPAYISFYNGRRFISTVGIETVPAYLPEITNANYINISFHDDYLLDLNIIELE